MKSLTALSGVLALDTETALFRPGVMAPELACVTYAGVAGTGLLHWTDAHATLKTWLEAPDLRIVGHFFAYDAAVICAQFPDLVPLVFAAYDADRICDSKIRLQLIDIAQGTYRGRAASDGTWIKYGYTLLEVAKRLTGVLLEKDEWRLKYGELRPLPLSQWPEGAVKYATDDAIATLACYEAQESAPKEWLAPQFHEARASFSQHLMSCWGLRTRPEGVAALLTKTEAALVDVTARLQAAGLVDKKGKRNTKPAKDRMLAVCAEEGRAIRKTKKEGVSLDEESCTATGDSLLIDYAAYTGLRNVITKDIVMLQAGTAYPVHTRFDLAETCRTTSSKPNIMNPSKKGGIRECFVPRQGKAFAQDDFPALELHTWAQCCMTRFGFSEMANALNAGMDPHTMLCAEILGTSYENAVAGIAAGDKEIKNGRDLGKVGNFGIIGGLGAPRIVEYAWVNFGIRITLERAVELKAAHAKRWPETKPFFARVRALTKTPTKLATTTALGVGRVRGGCAYTEACNDDFQALGAVCAKRAGWLIARACYAETDSVMYGSRPVAFLHDEYFTETDVGPRAHDVAYEQSRLMAVGANEFLPDVPFDVTKFKPVLMTHWSKDAQQVFHNGRLVPWEGKAK